MMVPPPEAPKEKPGAEAEQQMAQAAVCLGLALSHQVLPYLGLLLISHSWLSPSGYPRMLATRHRVLNATRPIHQLVMVALRTAEDRPKVPREASGRPLRQGHQNRT